MNREKIVETSLCRYAKCLENKVHPVFEKLEFYLNLNNDFALTFLRDELRVYFFFGSVEKIPDVVKVGGATRQEMSPSQRLCESYREKQETCFLFFF